LKLEASATAQEIIAFCRGRLAHFEAPRAVIFWGIAQDFDRQDPEISVARARQGQRVTRHRAQMRIKKPGGTTHLPAF
jgi:hypothetical protein